ncbi:MAG TPA: histidine kinase dimerization/phospho-acceptor domain-containing protein [Sphingomicrobium sp.]|nr:histidine kinase dimerization/phospho-acceptor domain-containing protein [Sphingomicrobium sp.]
MRFDDRLATVLAQPVGSARDRAIRWRQLVDLVARAGDAADPVLLGEAISAIQADVPQVGEPVRAATARAIAGLPVPAPLLEVFAADRLSVAAPLLAAVPLDDALVSRLRAVASKEVRPFLDTLAPPPAAEPEVEPEAAPPEPPAPAPSPPPKAEPVPSISEVVARIERLRSSRERSASARTAPPVPIGSPSLFRWECNPSGEIDWVEGAPRGPLVGRTIATADPAEGVDDCVERAFGIRAPFRDCVLELGDEGPLAGQWVISGVPAFAPNDGRFIGYRGVARRDEGEDHAMAEMTQRAVSEVSADHDSLREMIHEIKTPLNAIIGFAEIIDGQYFGPAHSRYRERAAEIVANARSLLEAAEDLDFAARLQSARTRQGAGTDLKTFFPPFAESLQARAARNGIGLDFEIAGTVGRCALEPELTERLLRRFTDAVLSAAASGEQLAIKVRQSGKRCLIAITRPKATMMAGKDDLLDPEFTIGEADRAMLGLGFSLRLVNGLVGIAGGALDIAEDQFTLSVPVMRG